MAVVRKNFKVDWYRCPVDRDTLRSLTKRSDIKGFMQTLGWIGLVGATAYMNHFFWARQIWLGFALALWVHGTIYTFNPGQITHELSHGTVFKTKWLNAFFLRFFSTIGMVNFHHYKRSNTYHHIYTLHPRGDREVVLPGNPTIKPLGIFWLFTINFRGLWTTLYKTVIMPAVFGRIVERGEWSEAIFPDDDPAGKKTAINFMRWVLFFHLSVIAIAIVTGYWHLPLIITVGNFIGSWWKFFIGITMHTGLRDNVPDFRKCCRTIKLDPFSRFIYWHMNYHADHHMYAAIPCYNLKKLSKEIAWDMPKPRTLVEAWREMRETYNRQKTDPDYQYDTPVPEKSERVVEDKILAGSIGELAPESIM
jgi:fatty acid desaturase